MYHKIKIQIFLHIVDGSNILYDQANDIVFERHLSGML